MDKKHNFQSHFLKLFEVIEVNDTVPFGYCSFAFTLLTFDPLTMAEEHENPLENLESIDEIAAELQRRNAEGAVDVGKSFLWGR